MLDKQDVQTIDALIEEKLDKRFEEFEKRMDEKMDKRFEEFEKRMDKKLEEMEERITRRTVAMMEAVFQKQFNLLAEQIQILNEKLIPEPRIEVLEENDDILFPAVRRLSRDVEALKKEVQELKKAT